MNIVKYVPKPNSISQENYLKTYHFLGGIIIAKYNNCNVIHCLKLILGNEVYDIQNNIIGKFSNTDYIKIIFTTL